MNVAWFAKVSLKNNAFQMIMIHNSKNNEEQIIHVWYFYVGIRLLYFDLMSIGVLKIRMAHLFSCIYCNIFLVYYLVPITREKDVNFWFACSKVSIIICMEGRTGQSWVISDVLQGVTRNLLHFWIISTHSWA